MKRLVVTIHAEDELGRILDMNGNPHDEEKASSPMITSISMKSWASSQMKVFEVWGMFCRVKDLVGNLFHVMNLEISQIQHLPHNSVFFRRKLAAIPEPEWIVNEAGELGVKIADRYFFMYKGDAFEYTEKPPGQGMYRRVQMREFGESGPISDIKKKDPKGWFKNSDGWAELPLSQGQKDE